jgi:hypothetical protein
MQGQYIGVKSRLLEINTKAYFVHCYAHRLNLVIVDTVSRNTMCRNFFGIISQLYNFIEGSTKRHGLFHLVQKEISSELGNIEPGSAGRTYSLNSVSQTRWSSRVESCRAIQRTLPAIFDTLGRISREHSYDRETGGIALSLLKSIDFEFCLVLVIMVDILKSVNIVSKYLQTQNLNIGSAASAVEALTTELKSWRTDEVFEKYWHEAATVADGLGVPFEEKRHRKVSRKMDEHWRSETIVSGKDNFRINFYFDVIDLMSGALMDRFNPDNTVPLLKSITCLHSPHLSKINELLALSTFFEGDFNSALLQDEYKLLNSLLVKESCKLTGIQEIYKWLVSSDFNQMLPSIAVLYKLVLTMPVTSSSNERCFSALKFVKNKLRTTMNQNRLEDLMIIAAEAERTNDIDLNAIRNLFWDKHNRR